MSDYLRQEANGISSSAQQRGEDLFVMQTAKRLEDRLVLERFGELNDGSDSNNKEIVENVDKVTRTEPHYIITREESGSVGSIKVVCIKIPKVM